MTIYVLNTTILTTIGLTYTSRLLGRTEARSLLGAEPTDDDQQADRAAGLVPVHVITGRRPSIVSAVGHESTAAIAATVLGIDVPVSRAAIAMSDGDIAVCLKLRGRPPEGAILTKKEVEAIGYDLVLIQAQDPARLHRQVQTIEDAAHFLAHSDDVAPADDEQTPGTRRIGSCPMQVHFIVRRALAHGGTYVEVIQEWGTDAWSVDEISAAQARERQWSGAAEHPATIGGGR